MTLDELRQELRALPAHPRMRSGELWELVAGVRDDIEAAKARGVAWKSITALISGYLDMPIGRDALRGRYRKVKAGIVKPQRDEPKQPAESAAEEPPRRKHCAKDTGGLIAAAITPDGRLFQLEHSSAISRRCGGGYGVYEVSVDGNLRLREGDAYPKLSASRDKSINIFCDWARAQGYDVHGEAAAKQTHENDTGSPA